MGLSVVDRGPIVAGNAGQCNRLRTGALRSHSRRWHLAIAPSRLPLSDVLGGIMQRSVFITTLAALCLLATSLLAAPQTLVVQGVLSSAAGGPAADGEYLLTFAIYPDTKAKDAAWSDAMAKVQVKNGRFVHVLGVAKPLDSKTLAGLKTPHFSVRIGLDPELPRQPLHNVLWSMVAQQVACTGCVGAGHIAAGAVSADKVGFTYAGAKTKGGPAEKALDLLCTGCVTVDALKFDKDVDLGGQALKAKKLAAVDIAATTVAANTFIGDGSKLTGIQSVSGSCKNAGEVVKGIAADGKLICVPALDPKALPPGGLNEISNGLLNNQFVDTAKSAAKLPIPDNNPIGATSKIVVPDWGVAEKVSISADLANSDISKVKLQLFDPKGGSYVLYDGGGKGKSIKTSWPVPNKPIKGDLGTWVGANPKGTWQLKVVDTGFTNNGNDGQVNSWSIEVHTLSDKKVATNGLAWMLGGVDFASSGTKGFRFEVAAKTPVVCDAKQIGYTYFNTSSASLVICDGKAFQAIAQISPGTSQGSAGKSCKALLDKGQSKDGTYWIDPDGGNSSNAFTAFCDMKGGGWTRLAYEAIADAKGWSSGSLTNANVAGKATKVHGMWGKGGGAQKSFDLKGVPHTAVRISGRYYAVDSWDNEGNGAQMHLDGKMVWGAKKSYSQPGQGAGWVTAKFTPAPWGNNGGPNGYWKLETAKPSTPHTAGKVLLKFATGLDQAASDESFGFSHVGVWVK